MNNNPTALATTIGMSALGMLAYLGYQNIQLEEDDIDKNSDVETKDKEKDVILKENMVLVNEEENKITKIADDVEDKIDLQKQAENIVKMAIEDKTTEWGQFWKGEYKDIKKEDREEIDSKPLPSV